MSETPATATPSAEQILGDYRLCYRSRQASLIGRMEVLTGKAKFGIFGDGKEVAQAAMARVFRKGDFRSGYYRDQTLLLALGLTTIKEFFAQLYANPDPRQEPASSGRQMNCHFASRWLDDQGGWLDQTGAYNSAADLSPVSSQMPRLVGLAWASRLYRDCPSLAGTSGFSRNGNEIAFGTIGNAGCAEGMFWEAVNAVAVLQAPMLLSIWDDGYGISVGNEQQVAKGDLSALLDGFRRRRSGERGIELYTVKGWDYPALVEVYQRAEAVVRAEHVPAVIHVIELTQPQGHSTSGSHERYKTPERLQWERDWDGVARLRALLLERGVTSEAELATVEKAELEEVRRAQREAFAESQRPILDEMAAVAELGDEIARLSPAQAAVQAEVEQLRAARLPLRRTVAAAAHHLLVVSRGEENPARRKLVDWKLEYDRTNEERYSSHLYSQSAESALNLAEVAAEYAADAPTLNGFEVVNRGFDLLLARYPTLIAFGEDVGRLGDVNQGLAGLQARYGELRVSDTGIRECTIVGQAIGLAMRGLRPIAEIQYLDYLHYALQILSDDLATLHYRTRGGQKAPVIVRTRGHRLEGIWHSGSPMAGIIHLVRGLYVCVPRDLTRAVGFYNTLLASDDSAIVVEVLNGYRRKERLPANLGAMTVPLGVPEVLRPGSDVTLVTYGACCAVALEAAERLAATGIDLEVIDVQTLLPFDRPGIIGRSLEKTSRVVFLDEDVPGGTTAYMMQQVLEGQHAYDWLDSEPRTVPGKPHRPAYGSDGDYWSKPGVEEVFDAVYALMREAYPARFPSLY